jgi:hypothetical protein
MDEVAHEYSPRQDITSFDAWILHGDFLKPGPPNAIALMAFNPNLNTHPYIKVRVQLTLNHGDEG